MSQPNGDKSPETVPTAPPAPAADVEDPSPPTRESGGGGGGYGVSAITRRWKREDLLMRGGLGLRAIGLLFSLLAFVVMASNRHGDWKNFDRYEEYRY